jgi:hypothetical protein
MLRADVAARLRWERKNKVVFMTKDKSKKNNEVNDPQRLGEDVDRSSMPARDPIEPDPMNPVSPADTEPNPVKRPDLDWSEHED